MSNPIIFGESSIADHELLAAVAGKRHFVHAYRLTSTSGTLNNAQFKSNTTAISGVFALETGVTMPQHLVDRSPDPRGYLYATAQGEALNLSLSAAVRADGEVWTSTS